MREAPEWGPAGMLAAALWWSFGGSFAQAPVSSTESMLHASSHWPVTLPKLPGESRA